MAARRSAILRHLESLNSPVLRGFLAAVRRMRSRAKIQQLADAISRGDWDGALLAVGYTDGAYALVREEVRSAYVRSGMFAASSTVPARFNFDFSLASPRVETWLQERNTAWYDALRRDQREAIQTISSAGFAAGQNPRTTALDIAGRINPSTGRRQGGVIGLNEAQGRYVRNAREDLFELNPRYLTRERRDRRLDHLFHRAVKEGRPISPSLRERMLARYSDRLLQLRAETIARTETLATMNAAQSEMLEQVIEQGLAPRDSIVRVWDSAADARTRDDHVAMDEHRRAPGEPFRSGSGNYLLYPGDTSLGAGAEDVINCRCVLRDEVDFVKVGAAS